MELWSRFKALFRRSRVEPVEPTLLSLVLFLREPAQLDVRAMGQAAGKALGLKIHPAPHFHENFITGRSPHLKLHLGRDHFLINSIAQPYFDDPDRIASQLAELRLRSAILQTGAWLSVDFVNRESSFDSSEVYQRIGRVVAALADSTCLAIYAPATGQIVAYDKTLNDKLMSDTPLEIFAEPAFSPVVGVSDNDPRMEAAAEEARSRWLEFLDAFGERRAGDHFSVKAPISDGRFTEFMWISVFAIENGMIFGRLGNEPVNVENLKVGDRLKVRVEDLNDWLFARGDEVIGGFTVKILDAIYLEQREQLSKRAN